MFGSQIITDIHCYEVQTIKRTWKERFLTWPWRPWVKLKTFHKPTAYRFGNQIICHPSMLLEIEKMIQKNRETKTVSQHPVIDKETQKVLDFLNKHLR